MDKFKVGDLVRLKPRAATASRYWNAVGTIAHIKPKDHYLYIVAIEEGLVGFAEDELERA